MQLTTVNVTSYLCSIGVKSHCFETDFVYSKLSVKSKHKLKFYFTLLSNKHVFIHVCFYCHSLSIYLLLFHFTLKKALFEFVFLYVDFHQSYTYCSTKAFVFILALLNYSGSCEPRNDLFIQPMGEKKNCMNFVFSSRRISEHKEKAVSEELFIDSLLSRHAQKLLSCGKLKDLGYFAAYLDFHLVTFFTKERFVSHFLIHIIWYYSSLKVKYL